MERIGLGRRNPEEKNSRAKNLGGIRRKDAKKERERKKPGLL